MHDAAQLERLHREHAGAVRAFVRRRIGDDEADEVVADVFVVAWRRSGDVPAEPRTWLPPWPRGPPTVCPAGLHPELASLIQEAGRSPIARTLIYAGNVLTAPRVDPDVRAAVYRALSRVPAVKVDPTAKDAFGRPAAAILAEDTDGKSRTRSELLIDPDTSRILAERHVFTPEPGVNENRGSSEPPYGEGSRETTCRYTH